MEVIGELEHGTVLLLISYLKLKGDQKLINFASQLCFRDGGMREEH